MPRGVRAKRKGNTHIRSGKRLTKYRLRHGMHQQARSRPHSTKSDIRSDLGR
jgi:hypothetical protein